jgi:hypothetical protein
VGHHLDAAAAVSENTIREHGNLLGEHGFTVKAPHVREHMQHINITSLRMTGGSLSVFPLAIPQPDKVHFRVEIGRFGLAVWVETARISTQKCEHHHFHTLFAKNRLRWVEIE